MTSDAVADLGPARRPRLRGPSAVLLLAAGAAVAQAFGRFAYGVLLPAVRDELGISNTVAGSLGTANVSAYLAGTVAVTVLSARLRLLFVLRVGLLLATIGLAISAVAPSATILGIGMVCSGFGGALTWIPTPAVATAASSRPSDSPSRVAAGAGVLAVMGLGFAAT